MKFFKMTIVATIFSVVCLNASAETLRMGVNLPATPFAYLDKSNKIVGYEVDLINKIGELKGFDVEIVPVTFPKVFEMLQNKEVDFISRIYHSEERKAKYNLTNPHYIETLEFVMLEDNEKITDPMQDEAKVSVLNFSPLHDELREIKNEHPNIQDVPAKSSFLSFKAIITKKADLVLSTKSFDYYVMRNYPDFPYAVFPVSEEYSQQMPISFLMLKDNTELLERLNAGLESVEASGYLDELKEKYHM